MRVYGNLDLLLNQIKNQVIDSLSSDPTSPATGQFWYNTTEKVLKYFDGTNVKVLATADELEQLKTDLASTESGKGASLIGISDTTHFTSTTVEGALEELASKVGSNDTDLSNLESAVGSAGPASAITYSSTNYVANGDSLVTAIGKLDTQVKTNADNIAQNASDITDLQNNKVSKAGDTLTGNLDFQGVATVTGLKAPTDASDAATKAYVDAKVSGITWKQPVRILASENISDLSAAPISIDGITLAEGDRVLVVGQSDKTQNGVYVVQSVDTTNNTASLVRADDELTSGDAWFVQEGSNYHDTGWTLTTDGTITVGTTELDFVQFTGLGEVIAGTGLKKDGNTIYVQLGAGIVELPTDEVGLDLYAGGGLHLVDPTTGEESTGSDSQLAIKLDGNDLVLSSNGLKISDEFKNSISTTTGNLQAEVDNIENAVGLNEDGTFASFSGTNYVDSATSIKNAIELLDTQVKTNADNLSAFESDLASTEANKGASLVGVSGSFTNAPGATQVQAVLESFDTAITNAGKRYLYTASAAGTSFTITHNLGHQFVVVTVYDSADNNVIIPESIVATDENTLTVTFANSVKPIIKIVA